MKHISRRSALQGITTFGLIVMGRAPVVMAQPAPLVRRDVTQLLQTPDELKRYQEAVSALKGKLIGGRSAWEINADTHRIYCARDAKEIHGTWWFLPWHRAYLHATERNLQKALGDPNVALPYWHWPLTPHVPKVYETGSLDHTPRDPYIPIEPWRWTWTVWKRRPPRPGW